MSNRETFIRIKQEAHLKRAILVVVSKKANIKEIQEIYNSGHRTFGESKTQDLREKYETLPKDIKWHMIGHLQKNKVKYITPFISLIHSVHSRELLEEINKHAHKNNRRIPILLQIKIAQEDTKQGLTEKILKTVLDRWATQPSNVDIAGLMGMASHTKNKEQIKQEFEYLAKIFQCIKIEYFKTDQNFKELSIGMSSDYKIALEAGATIIRVGRKIFE